MLWDETRAILVTTFKGLVDYTEQEVSALGFAIKNKHSTGLETTGTLRDCMKLCLHLRTALTVQWLLADFSCANADDLYRNASEVDWETMISQDGYLSINSRVENETITNSMFPNLKLKDAIVDRITTRMGARPDSGPDETGTVVNLYWKKDRAWIYVCASGKKLTDRGYRRIPFAAPLRENLAASLVLATGYDGTQPMVCPMCGSGTLAIEAALIAQRRAPGLLRTDFGFQHILGCDDKAYENMRREARNNTRKEALAPIVASDISPAAVDAARRNAMTAGVDRLIQFHVCDFAKTPMPTQPGIVILNPEYGDRLGVERELEAIYKRIGDFFKQSCPGYKGYLFTGNMELAKKVGLKASKRMPFWNAKIECRLFEYELYAGTRRQDKPDQPAGKDSRGQHKR